ncbi:MAG: EAL domain-containing protein [Zoogloea sp.]|nr:EAL domain-containing protein [Zoogloea sp.]
MSAASPCVVGIARDISARKDLEERLNLYSKVFESAAEGIFITDTRPRIIAVNPAFTAITGYALAEVSERDPRMLKADRLGDDEYAEIWRAARETGRWQGEIWNRAKSGEAYPQSLSLNAVRDESGRLAHYVAIFSDISKRKAEEERVRFLAQHDGLTGLPNRDLLRDRLTQAIALAHRHRGQVAVLFLDLDGFKGVNDTFGHRAGDVLLCRVAERLKACVRDQDTVARLGGDEFVLVLPLIGHTHAPEHVAHKIIRTLAEPQQIEGERVSVGVSIGISVYPEDGGDVETLLRNADAAMYLAKTRGNHYEFYASALTGGAVERIELEDALRAGIANGELRLFYQPKVDLATGLVSGAEALLRWFHPDWGVVMPGAFLPVAEETGLIGEMGDWVLHAACRQNRIWQDEGLPAVPVAVNLSNRQFRRGLLAATVSSALSEAGLDAPSLELELTERMMVEGEEVGETLDELKSIGVRLSIDGFGTGTSSLSLLGRLPLDSLKIDRSFVGEITSGQRGSLVLAVISLAHTFHLTVTAEGVGTRMQVQYLHEHDCDTIQGYYVSRPLPADEFAAFLKRATPLDMAGRRPPFP